MKRTYESIAHSAAQGDGDGSTESSWRGQIVSLKRPLPIRSEPLVVTYGSGVGYLTNGSWYPCPLNKYAWVWEGREKYYATHFSRLLRGCYFGEHRHVSRLHVPSSQVSTQIVPTSSNLRSDKDLG